MTALRRFEFNDTRSVLRQVILLHQSTGLFLLGIDVSTVHNLPFLLVVIDLASPKVRREELLLMLLLAARLQIFELRRIV